MAASGTQLRPRSLTVADAEALAALSLKLGGSETVAQWVAFFGRPHAIAVGSIADGHIVGYAAGEVRTGFGLPKPVAWVEAFGIDLEYRGAGLGRTLLGELLRRAATLGAAHIYTLVPVHDRVLAPFFRQLGFRDEPLSCLGCSL
ncbi:MAG: GNAT family N-acetyltransferase [Chloroflexota bacterium]|nr:GNAT family N-acetyltransferase [Chloroflexota bacterium]MDE3192318.1 GNAT family N-acetyltransferase [Chloroflexota bacterium]